MVQTITASLLLLRQISYVFFLFYFSVSVHAQQATDASKVNSPDRALTGFEALNEAQPLWEFGAAGGATSVANYPASSERNFIALAAPYIVYRGDVFRVGGGNGVRAVVVDKNDFEIDISFGGAFSADSDDNTVREGMPELDYLFEVGPQVVYKIKDISFNNGGKARINARLQTRAVFSTDFGSIDQRGFVIEPNLSYQQRGMWLENTALNLSFSMTFASEKLQDYFYQVDTAFATESRPHFDAKSGYLSSELYAGFSFPLAENIRGFLNGRLYFHHGAANNNSPLFEDNTTFTLGLGFVWRLYESDTKASW